MTTTLVLGGTGNTGSRVAARLRDLGAPPREFADYAHDTAATGIWSLDEKDDAR